MSLRLKVKSAKKIRYLKKVTPWMFPEYLHLKSAEQALEAAKTEVKEAKKAWKDL